MLTVGPIVAAGGLALLAFADLKGPYWTNVFPALFFLSVGMAITVPPLTSTVMGAAGKAHAGIASGINSAVARVAGLLAVAALGAVFFVCFSIYLPETTAAQANAALNAVMSGQPGVNQETVLAFARALRFVMLVTAGCAAPAGLIGWLWVDTNSARAGR
jgi:hypothetical protein